MSRHRNTDEPRTERMKRRNTDSDSHLEHTERRDNAKRKKQQRRQVHNSKRNFEE
jgi:hypothetical protein